LDVAVEVADHRVELARGDAQAGHGVSVPMGPSGPEVGGGGRGQTGAVLPPGLDDDIERAADPPTVRVALERLGDAHPGLLDRLDAEAPLRRAVIAVSAASRSLTRLLERDDEAVEVLADLEHRRRGGAQDVGGRVRWTQHEYLRIAARDLLGLDALEATGAALSSLAADVFDTAIRFTRADDLVVVGMGKLGGSELNYASDVDVLFVGEGPAEVQSRRARAVMDLARRCFRVDANLRPEGRDGPLVRSLASYEAYWERWAHAWEFQALLKARPIAGPADLRDAFAASASEHLWRRPFTADDIRAVRAMKQRAESEVSRRGIAEREIKRGRGGLRDIEFAVQLLQLVHGHVDIDLRTPTTLTALETLGAGGYVDPDDAAAMAAAYRFLRRVEHRLQIVEEQQTHTVPADRGARRHLARVLGFRGTPDAGATDRFDAALSSHQSTVRTIHERLYFRPLLEAFAGSTSALTPEAAATRMAAFGFADAERTRQAVQELTRGLTRSSRLMQQVLPLLLDWLSDTPDPDLGLLYLRRLASGPQRSTALASAFRDSPEVARRLCRVVGTSRLLGDVLVANPDLIERLPDHHRLQTLPRDELVASVGRALGWREERAEQQRGLHRWKMRHLLGIAARDLFGHAGVERVGDDLTALAEASLEAALRVLEPPVPFAVIALGRFGGDELSYASDLDVVFVYEGSTAGDYEAAERTATALLRFVGGDTPAGRIWDLDTDLRPEGRKGPLARSVEGVTAYVERWAQTWERQAMVRARPVAGDRDVARRFMDVVDRFVWGRDLTPEETLEIRRMKARVESERIPAGEDPEFHLKLGKGSLSDVEFTVQLLQLRHGIPSQGTIDALTRLGSVGVIGDEDAQILADAYRFCERTRNRWFLVNGGPGDSLPVDPDRLARLARSLSTSAPELRDTYRRLTRRSRRVVERLFYGRD
jgi:glutamate-ammonia-ligase adenylyltransferase